MDGINFKRPLVATNWLLALAGDYAIIAVAFLIAYLWGWPAYPATILMLGIAQHRIGILGHEGVHGLICKNKQFNYWFAQLFCFWPLLFDFKSYQKFHQQHHSHTDDEHLDPEHQLKDGKYQLPKSKIQIYGRFALDCCGASFPEFFVMMAYFAKRSNPLWAFTSLIMNWCVFYYTGHPEFFFLLMISKPTTFWAVFRLRIYSEHVPGVHRLHVSLWQRWLFAPHNIWIHWEHHKHPQVPFWQLPKLRAHYANIPITNFDSLLHKKKTGWEEEYEEDFSPIYNYPVRKVV
jgi:fatty acid desaturase